MDTVKIDNMHKLITKLRAYFNLVKQENLNASEKEKKEKLTIELSVFLNELDSFTMMSAKSSQTNYSMKMMGEFFLWMNDIRGTMSTEEDKEYVESRDFGIKITELMKQKKVKSKDVIEVTGINQSVFSKAKVGLRKPSKEVISVLSEYFKYDLSKYE